MGTQFSIPTTNQRYYRHINRLWKMIEEYIAGENLYRKSSDTMEDLYLKTLLSMDDLSFLEFEFASNNPELRERFRKYLTYEALKDKYKKSSSEISSQTLMKQCSLSQTITSLRNEPEPL